MAPSEPKDVNGGVVVSVQFCTTLATMPAFTECFLANLTTATTDLAGIVGIDEQHRSTSICSFVGTELLEHAPTSIDNTFVQAAFGSRSVREILPVLILFRLGASFSVPNGAGATGRRSAKELRPGSPPLR